jgi:hypothetical protein
MGQKILWDSVSKRVQYFLPAKSAFKNSQHILSDLASRIEAAAGLVSEPTNNMQ